MKERRMRIPLVSEEELFSANEGLKLDVLTIKKPPKKHKNRCGLQ